MGHSSQEKKLSTLSSYRNKLSARTCPTGQYLYGIASDGSTRCRSHVRSRMCSGNQVLRGISGTQPVCTPYHVQPRFNKACKTGEAIRAVDPNGRVTCARASSEITSIKARVMSSYCSRHSRGRGWDTYCHDRLEHDSMGGNMLRRESRGNYRVRQAGYYKINFYMLAHGCGHKHVRVMVNNRQRMYRYFYQRSSQWDAYGGSFTYWYNANDVFKVDSHGDNCNPYRWHAGGSSGAHSRMQITYLGRR